MDDEPRTIIFDIGSCQARAGFGGDDAPRVEIPTLIGRVKDAPIIVRNEAREFFVGDDAVSRSGDLELTRPIDHGIVSSWNDWERLTEHIVNNELRRDLKDFGLLFSTPALAPPAQLERMTQTYFELYDTPFLAAAFEPAMAILASGRTTGISVSVGGGVLQIIPIHDGIIIQEALVIKKFGGADLTRYMATLLAETWPIEAPFAESLLVDVARLKNYFAYVALDYDAEMELYRTSAKQSVEASLGSGSNKVTLGTERFRVGEAVFNPAVLGLEQPGLHHLIYESIIKCPENTRQDLIINIILHGGCTMLSGLADRLCKEMLRLLPPDSKMKIVAAPERKLNTWIGGSILTQLPKFTSWFTKERYEEVGPSGIHNAGIASFHNCSLPWMRYGP